MDKFGEVRDFGQKNAPLSGYVSFLGQKLEITLVPKESGANPCKPLYTVWYDEDITPYYQPDEIKRSSVNAGYVAQNTDPKTGEAYLRLTLKPKELLGQELHFKLDNWISPFGEREIVKDPATL